VFGNKNNYTKQDEFAQQSFNEEIKQEQPQEIVQQPQTVQKKGLFGRKNKVEKFKSVGTENPFREVNMFIPELIAIVLGLAGTIFTIFMVRFTAIGQLETTKDALGEAYPLMANLIQTTNQLTLLVGAIPLLILVGFFLYRFMVFQPRKNKFVVRRIFKTGAIRTSVDTLPSNKKIPFGKGFDSDTVWIGNPRKHWDYATGKPIIEIFEGDSTNANLNDYAQGINQKAKDSNTINDMAVSFGQRLERYLQEKKNNFLSNPIAWFLIVIIIVMALIAFVVLRQTNMLESMVGAATA